MMTYLSRMSLILNQTHEIKEEWLACLPNLSKRTSKIIHATKECRDICEFVSWIEKDNKVYFLTGEQIFSTSGQRKLKRLGVSPDDYSGHGTIRAWYKIGINDGRDRECVNFSSPDNFPTIIVDAIKSGQMRGLGRPKGLLTATEYRAYLEAIATAYRAYLEATAPAYRAYLEAIATEFWDLFADPKNRVKVWR